MQQWVQLDSDDLRRGFALPAAVQTVRPGLSFSEKRPPEQEDRSWPACERGAACYRAGTLAGHCGTTLLVRTTRYEPSPV
jgi:hypothetical protein